MTIKKTREEVNFFHNSALIYRQNNNKKSKFNYALGVLLNRQTEKIQKTTKEKIEDINTEHAAVDRDGVLLRDGDNYKYTKDEAKKRLQKIRQVWKEEVEIEPYYATDVPQDLTLSEIDAFTDFVLRRDAEDLEEESEAEKVSD